MESGINLIDCFELQLSEIEMLSSMYPNSEEFTISFPFVLADIKSYVAGESEFLPNQLDFTLNLKIPDIKDILELNVCLPHKYPHLKPDVYVRSVGLTRPQQKQLNASMLDYVKSLPQGDLCVLSIITWLTENAMKYFSLSNQAEDSGPKKETSNTGPVCRMWIYSHHIYNKFKRREIVDSALDLNLTGFSLPGKPGFICIEGYKGDCSEFLQRLKQMSWKKISLVREEVKHSANVDSFRKFQDFSEISFQVRRGPAREYHMDMGQFLKYLTEHNCAYAFQDLFGLEGQTSSEK